MKLLKLKDAEEFKNNDQCGGVQYQLNDKDIDFSIATINGKYPETGYCMNEKCKELIYVQEGTGTLNKKDEVISFEKGDLILIDKEEPYSFDAHCTIIMQCTPSWYIEQHKNINNI